MSIDGGLCFLLQELLTTTGQSQGHRVFKTQHHEDYGELRDGRAGHGRDDPSSMSAHGPESRRHGRHDGPEDGRQARHGQLGPLQHVHHGQLGQEPTPLGQQGQPRPRISTLPSHAGFTVTENPRPQAVDRLSVFDQLLRLDHQRHGLRSRARE